MVLVVFLPLDKCSINSCNLSSQDIFQKRWLSTSVCSGSLHLVLILSNPMGHKQHLKPYESRAGEINQMSSKQCCSFYSIFTFLNSTTSQIPIQLASHCKLQSLCTCTINQPVIPFSVGAQPVIPAYSLRQVKQKRLSRTVHEISSMPNLNCTYTDCQSHSEILPNRNKSCSLS